MTPLLSRFLQNNIRASLDKLALRNRGVGQKKISGPLTVAILFFPGYHLQVIPG
jgi:hypothetical protein